MPGKHAPASSKSFFISLGTALGGAVAALGIVVGIALVALNAGTDKDTRTPAGSQTTPPPRTQTTPPAISSPSPTPSQTSTSSTTTEVSKTTLRVLNGSGRGGVAKTMAQRAKDEGYPEPAVGNTTRTTKSTVYFAQGRRAEAEEFQRRFPEFTEIAPAPSTFASDVMLSVVVGLDYQQASPSPTPSA